MLGKLISKAFNDAPDGRSFTRTVPNVVEQIDVWNI